MRIRGFARKYRSNFAMEEFRGYSVLDFLRSQKQSVELCRFIFCATTTLSTDRVLKFFARCARENFANGATGLVLVYPRHVVNLIESSEDEVFRICSHFVNAEPKILGASKCFPVQSRIDERFFHKWHARRVADDRETVKIDGMILEDFDEVKKIYCRFIENLYNFCDELRASRTISRACFMEKLDAIESKRDLRLPEVNILESILQSPWGDSLERIVEDYHRGLSSTEVEEVIWPFPTNHCPPIDAIK